MRTLVLAVTATGLGVAGLTTVTEASTMTQGVASYTCYGQQATLVGTPGDDLLIGREDTADVIVGLGGDDIIFGAEDINAATAPGDRLCGGAGADYIRGGVGEDRIQGGRGADNVDGGFQLDVITQGGPGNDRVTDCDSEYTGGARQLKGGPGDDYLCVDIDVTRMYGEGGDDRLVELDCRADSWLVGGQGNDHVRSAFDNLEGTRCSDPLVFADPGSDLVDGSAGSDSARVNGGDRVLNTEVVTIR